MTVEQHKPTNHRHKTPAQLQHYTYTKTTRQSQRSKPKYTTTTYERHITKNQRTPVTTTTHKTNTKPPTLTPTPTPTHTPSPTHHQCSPLNRSSNHFHTNVAYTKGQA